MKTLKEYRIKELKSQKKWEKVDNVVRFIFQTFMLSIALNGTIIFFITGLGLKVKTTMYLPIACFMLVIMLQTIYMVTKQHTENVKEINNKYKKLIDKIE